MWLANVATTFREYFGNFPPYAQDLKWTNLRINLWIGTDNYNKQVTVRIFSLSLSRRTPEDFQSMQGHGTESWTYKARTNWSSSEAPSTASGLCSSNRSSVLRTPWCAMKVLIRDLHQHIHIFKSHVSLQRIPWCFADPVSSVLNHW